MPAAFFNVFNSVETGKAAGLFVRSAVVFIQQPGQHTFFFHNMPCGRTFIMRVVAGNIFDVAQMLAEPFISIGMVKSYAGAEHIHEGKSPRDVRLRRSDLPAAAAGLKALRYKVAPEAKASSKAAIGVSILPVGVVLVLKPTSLRGDV